MAQGRAVRVWAVYMRFLVGTGGVWEFQKIGKLMSNHKSQDPCYLRTPHPVLRIQGIHDGWRLNQIRQEDVVEKIFGLSLAGDQTRSDLGVTEGKPDWNNKKHRNQNALHEESTVCSIRIRTKMTCIHLPSSISTAVTPKTKNVIVDFS